MNIKKIWNTENRLALVSNTLTTLAIFTSIGLIYISNIQDGYRQGLNYYNLNSLHYSINFRISQLLLNNRSLKYTSDLPKDAYLSYLVMQDHNFLKDIGALNKKVDESVNTIDDYEKLATQDPYITQNKYSKEYDEKIKLYGGLIRSMAIAGILFQILSLILSFRVDKLNSLSKL